MNTTKMLVFLISAVASSSVYAGDTLEEYAQKCDQAIGVTVPDFLCSNGTLVPTTHFVNRVCDRPNQLNQVCDPGSRFQVLSNDANTYVVAHCRKGGLSLNAELYGDIAVIQHNKVTGATCFYQGALGALSHDGNVKAPSKGVGSPQFWMTPSAIASSSFPCAGCHDNGPIIRSPYLSQITGPNKLPGAGDGLFNRDQPYFFVGSDFASWKAYKVEVPDAQGRPNLCTTCHRMGVNNLMPGKGTSRDFGIRATAPSQQNKHPHSVDSPMWMLVGQTSFNQANADAAKAIKNCADQFNLNSPLPSLPSCKITQFTGLIGPSSAGLVFLFRSNDGAIWVVFNGGRFHVPDPATLSRLYAGIPILPVSSAVIDRIPPHPIDASLLREENGAIWVVFGQARFHVPDPATFARLYGGKPVLQLWNGGPNSLPTIPIDGTLVREENGAIWVVFGQARFHVPNPPTLARLYGGRPVFQLWNGAPNAIPTVPIDGTLLREENGAIWVVFGQARFHIPNPQTLARLYSTKPVFQLWDGAPNAIPTAPIDGTLLREENGAIWVVFGRAKFHVPNPPTLARLYGGKPVRQLWDGALNGISSIPIDGTLLREESSTQVFRIQNGKKVPVPSTSAGIVNVVWTGALSQIP